MPAPRQYASDADRQRAFRQRQAEARRTAIAAGAPPAPAIPTMPSTARWKALHDQARAAVQTMVDEMTAYQGDRSEQWQESDRGTEFDAKLQDAGELLDALDAFSLD